MSEGRDESLSASLSYGFEHAFNEAERKQLALLHFFQGFVNVKALRAIGTQAFDWSLPELHGLTDEAGKALLDRAAEVELLQSTAMATTSSIPPFRGSSRDFLNSITPP